MLTAVARTRRSKLAPGEVGSIEEIALRRRRDPAPGPEQGRRLSRRDRQAAYKRSAACTHAGCIVHWNPFEKCWDCPCHGSQFAPDGTAMNGPAVEPLEEA